MRDRMNEKEGHTDRVGAAMNRRMWSGRWLRSRRFTGYLMAVHVVLLLVAIALPQPPSPDEATYLALAESMTHGGFSVWDGIYDPVPVEVHRTHGYPAFLMVVRMVSKSKFFLGLVQGALYLLALWLVLRYLRTQEDADLRRNVFLLAMLPQLQLLYYVGQVFPEPLMVLLLTALALSYGRGMGRLHDPWVRILLLVVAFWVRPIVLLLPLFLLVVDLFLEPRAQWIATGKRQLVVIAGFVLLGPFLFACWNLRTHGYFKPVPLTGSAVISNLGLWQLRLPGYGTVHYFQYNTFGREIIPWVDEANAARYYSAYQEQWDRIEARAATAMTPEDRAHVPAMMEHNVWATRSPAYTIALDQAIREENWAMIKADPWYYLVSRLYTSVRLWVTNINLPMERVIYRLSPGEHPRVGRPAGAMGWAKALIPFLITFVTFGLGLPFLLISVIRDPRRWYARRYLLATVGYVWLIHIPMLIQSRYTVPVHVLAILCIVLALTDRKQAPAPVGQPGR